MHDEHRLTTRVRRAALAVAASAIAVAIGAGAVAVAAPTSTQAVACHESGEVGRLYTVTLCITSPEDGATLTGASPVTATVTVNGTSPGVRRLTFFLGGQYLLTDYQAPYQFELPTQKFVDGPRTLEVEAWMRDGFITERTPASLVFQNGVTTPPVNTNTFTPTTGTDPGAGSLVIGAAGDGAGGDQSEADAVDLISSWNPNLFLYLGDVYEKGTTTEFDNWYRPSNFYGRFRPITNPTIGNHEYENGQAPGYFDYWDNVPHYFSVDTHGWHLISLDANVAFNQTAPGTAQYQWLVSDLEANTQPCTLVYYHQPLYNIGEEGSSGYLTSIWSLLAQHSVDLVVNGHDHTYQRWQPLDGAGNPSPAGVTEIIAGTGGHALGSFITTDSRVVASATEFGALRLDLNSGGATFQFANTQGQVRDSGSVSCDSSGSDTTPPSAPTGLTATATYKTNIDLSWGASTDNIGVTGYRIYRDGSFLTGIGPELSYSDGTVLAGSTHTYTVRAIDAQENLSDPSNEATATTPTSGVLFHDGFESGGLSNWTQSTGLVVQGSQVFAGSFAARGTTSGTGGASALKQLPATETNLYYVTRFKVLSQAASTNINLLRFRNSLGAANPIATAFVTSTDRIGLRNDVTGVPITSTAVAARNTWHTLQVHIVVNGLSSQTEVWLDGVAIPALTQSNVDLGANPIGKLELGDPTATKTYDIVYDEVAYDRQLIGDVVAPSAPTNLAAAAHSGLRVDLSWTPATDDIGVTGYDVYRNDALIDSIPAASTYADTTVSPHTSYTYKLKAKDGAGNLSDFSNTASASTGDVFADGFETGNLSAWTTVNGLNVQQQLVDAGQWAARATSNGSAGSSAQVTLDAARGDLYYRTRFHVVAQGANSVSLLRFRTAANGALSSVFISSTGKLSYRNDISAATVASPATVTQNTWHELQAHVFVNGDASQVELWLDGVSVLTQTQALGSTPIGRLELGDPGAGRIFDVAFDRVLADTAFIPAMPINAKPTKPQGLSAVAIAGQNRVDLSWQASTDDVAVTGYRIYRNGAATPTATVDGSTTNYSDLTVDPVTAYSYTVSAWDGTSESDPSDPASVVTSDTIVPQPPTGLAATTMSDSQINLVWNAGSDNVAVTGYRIYRNGSATPVAVVDGSATSYPDVGLAAGTTYTYVLTAVDAAGNQSIASSGATATTTDSVPPQPPTGLVATSTLDTEINLRWTAATDNVAVTGYRIYRDGGTTPLVELPATSTTYADKPLAPETTHTYSVDAIDRAGNASVASNSVTATTPVFGDGFETGNMSRWTSVAGLSAQNTDRFTGLWSALAQSNKGTVDYAVKQLPAAYSTLYYRLRLKLSSGKPDTVDVLNLRTASGANLFGLRYESKRRLASINNVTGVSSLSSSVLSVGVWYELKVRLTVNGTASQVEVWLNGTRIAALSKTDSFGTAPIGQVVAGESAVGHDYSFAIDDVLVDTKP
jgi:fibronectin type 3 domain-containing protein